MTRLALVADVHANLEALEACLADARGRGADGYAFLGDLVGYGADPGPVVDTVRRLVDEGAIAVRGNHDAAVAVAGGSDSMRSAAERAIVWTRDRLSPAQRAFLEELPLTARAQGALLVHASADAPADWGYVLDALGAERSLAAAGAAYVFCGHVHAQRLYFTGRDGRAVPFDPVPNVPIPVPTRRRWLAIAGSAGQPRDGSAAAAYAMMDFERATLTFVRVPYDWATAAAKVRAAGLPEELAARLERGG